MDRKFIVYCNGKALEECRREVEAIETARMLFHEGNNTKVVEEQTVQKILHEFGGAA